MTVDDMFENVEELKSLTINYPMDGEVGRSEYGQRISAMFSFLDELITPINAESVTLSKGRGTPPNFELGLVATNSHELYMLLCSVRDAFASDDAEDEEIINDLQLHFGARS